MARNDWTADEIEVLIDNFNKTKDEIGVLLSTKGFDRTVEAIKTKKRDLRRKGEMPTAKDVLELAEAVGEIELMDTEEAKAAPTGYFPGVVKKDLYGEYRTMMMALIDEEKAKSPAGDPSPVTSDAESLVVVLSDLHVGKIVENCDGEEVFNTAIAVERIEQLGRSVQRVITHAKKTTGIDEIVVCLVGDILDGENIYKSHAFHTDSHIAYQVKNATKALWDLIVELASVEGIEKVRVATIRGNHGRAGEFGHEDSNLDNILYDNLEFASILHGDSKITVTTKYSAHHIVTVRGHRLLLRHEAPLTCDTSAARAKLAGWIDMHNADCIISGHYHHVQISTYADRYIIRNGSLVGPDSLSERMAVTSKPEQLIFGVTERRLPSFIYPVTLT